jgi:hypothetical protein
MLTIRSGPGAEQLNAVEIAKNRRINSSKKNMIAASKENKVNAANVPASNDFDIEYFSFSLSFLYFSTVFLRIVDENIIY